MSMRFANRTIIVTGAASGIGLACTGLFLEEGANVVLADIDEEALAEVIAAIPPAFAKRAAPVVCDVGNARQVDALHGYAQEHFGSLDCVVCAAAVLRRSHFPDIPEDDFDAVIRTNLKGTFLCVQAAARVMMPLLERGRDILGSIVTISDDGAFGAMPHVVPHIMAAGGIDRMTVTLAKGLAGTGIRINTLAVGPVDTPMLRAATGGGKTALNAGLARTAQARAFDADEIAKAVAFLCCADASAVTGQVVGTGGI